MGSRETAPLCSADGHDLVIQFTRPSLKRFLGDVSDDVEEYYKRSKRRKCADGLGYAEVGYRT